jgi:hypothetical protein
MCWQRMSWVKSVFQHSSASVALVYASPVCWSAFCFAFTDYILNTDKQDSVDYVSMEASSCPMANLKLIGKSASIFKE